MASRKNLVLASLVSLVMVLSFGIGLVPMLTVSPDQSAKAAPGASLVAISVDGATPVGASYAMPVGSEQGFGALWLVGDSAQALNGGEIEWSLATDGSAAMIGGAGDAVATVRALAPGEAGLYVRTADGQVGVVNLTFYEMQAAEAKLLSAVTVTSPQEATRLVAPATATGALLSLTAQVDDPVDTQSLFYVLDSAASEYATEPPYAVAVSDVAAGAHQVLARAVRAANGAYVDSTPVNFEVILGGTDANGDGLPDDLFGVNLGEGDLWSVDANAGGFDRQVGITPLPGGDAKAIPLPAGGATVTIVDPSNTERWLTVTAPAGLVGPGQEGLLVVEAADTAAGLLGSTQADLLPTDGPAPVEGSRFANVNIVVSGDGGTSWANLDEAVLLDNPVVVQMGGLAVTDNQSASFFVHPTLLDDAGPAVTVVADSEWAKPESGTDVDEFTMSAELTSLGVFYAAALPTSPNIGTIMNISTGGGASGYSIGGDTLQIVVDNLQTADVVTVTIDGNVASSTRNGNTITATVPAANALLAPAESAPVDIRVDVSGATSDFDAIPGGFTYLGPAITNVTATASAGSTVVITGAGFQDSPGTQVTLDGISLTVLDIAANGTSITARLGSLIPASGAAVDLTVTNANLYTGTQAGAVTVSQAAPTLTDVTPDALYNDNQYALYLTGTNFVDTQAKQALFVGAQVYLSEDETANPEGDTPVAELDIVDATRLVADVPQGLAPGTWNVYVATLMYSTDTGTPSAPQLSNTLPVEILDPSQANVSITNVDPNFGLLAGGTVVAITGVNLRQAVIAYEEYNPQVFFGANAATINADLSSETQLVVTTPPGDQPGPVDVRVVNPAADGPGNFAIAADAFTYTQPALEVSPLTAFSANGPQSGPFAPSSATYTVTNAGIGPLQFAVSANETWVAVSPETGTIPEGGTAPVEISFSTDAALLEPGSYQAVVTIADADGLAEPIDIAVNLTVSPSGLPVLGVLNADNLESDGPIGGPFDPTGITYTVSNIGEGSLQWTLAFDADWISVSSTGGTLTAAATEDVAVTLNSAAESLAEGVHVATLTFDDVDPQTAPIIRTVTLTVRQPIPPTLRVEPQSGFASAGKVGGPFLPVSKTWDIYNDGDQPLTWDASLTYGDTGLPEWLTLVVGANDVYVAINDNANGLQGSAAGTIYTATLTVTGNGGTATRPIALTVYAAPQIDEVLPFNVAPLAGGTTIYLRGSFVDPTVPGLNGQNRVFFTTVQGQANPGSDIPAASVSFLPPDLLEVLTPAHAEGTFDVYVVSSVEPAGGLIEQTSNLHEFFFADPTLDITSVVPSEGPIAGGTEVTISGAGPFPVTGEPLVAKQDTGTTFRVADAVYNLNGETAFVTVPFELERDVPPLAADEGPASITGTFLYDPAVLEFVSGSRNLLLRDWYDKQISFNMTEPGRVQFVLASINSNEITTFDNQLPVDEGHDPNARTNPFPLGSLRFNVLATEAVQSAITVYELNMVDASESPGPFVIPSESDPGTVTINASAELAIEDVTITNETTSVGVDVDLVLPAGGVPNTGPAEITAVIDYDETVFQFTGADPGAEVVTTFGKTVVVTDNDPVAGQLTLHVFTESGTNLDITSALTLVTLNFNVLQAQAKGIADGVQPFEIVELTWLAADGSVFPGAAGPGEVGTVTVTQVAEGPLVYFGANQADVLSSVTDQIVATTPAGDRRGPVDVVVIDPNVAPPRNYGILINGFAYLLPEIAVTPAENYEVSGTEGGNEFTPSSKSYFVRNAGNGTLGWTATVDQTWVLLNGAVDASGSLGEGDSEMVTVTIDPAAVIAQELGVGVHTATITFADDSGNTGPVTRQVILTIAGVPTLRVEPATDLNFAGTVGGAITPLSSAFGVYVDGTGTLAWSAVADAAWVYLDPASGSVSDSDAEGDTVTVTLVPAQVALLGAGTFTANVTFTADGQEVVRQVVLTLVQTGDPLLVVQETALLESTGPQGGPFVPGSIQYTVENQGGGTLNYTVSEDATWVDLTNATGSLIGGETATVTVTINQAAASLLTPGVYTATVSFNDENISTPAVERVVTLTVQGAGEGLTVTAPVAGDEFERGDIVAIAWTYTGSADENLFVDIVLLTDGANPVSIAEDVTNNVGANTFNWTVPAGQALSRDYTIQVTSTDTGGPTATSGLFSVVDPQFTITEPSGPTSVRQGQTLHVEWIYTEIEPANKLNEQVDIWLFNGNTPVVQIADNVPNPAADEPGNADGINEVDAVVPGNAQVGSYRVVITPANSTEILAATPEGFVTVQPRIGVGTLIAGLIAALLGLAGGGGDGGGGGPCFIATAAYGTPLAGQIDTLRQFRDMYMLSNPLGIAAADAYYHVSPAIADLIAKSPVLAALVRLILLPVIVVAKLAVSMPLVTMALAVLASALYALRRYSRRSHKA